MFHRPVRAFIGGCLPPLGVYHSSLNLNSAANHLHFRLKKLVSKTDRSSLDMRVLSVKKSAIPTLVEKFVLLLLDFVE